MIYNFIIYSLIIIVFLSLFNIRERLVARNGIRIYTIFAVVWLWVVLAFREPTGDPWRYMIGLNEISKLSITELLNYKKVPIGFGVINWLTATISTNSALFFSVVYIFCLLPLYMGFRERVSNLNAFVLLMLYLLYPFYINYLGSGFKQGIGLGFMLWGLNSILDRDDPNWAKGIILLFTSTLFHSSFWLVNITFVAWLLFYRKRSMIWALWTLTLCIFLAASGAVNTLVSSILPQSFIDSLGFSSYFDDDLLSSSEYLDVGYKEGFRFDFTIFTIAPLLLIHILTKGKLTLIDNDLIKVYSLIASCYFLFVFIPYSDRIASFSWFLSPFMIYTYLNQLDRLKYRNIFVFLTISSYPLLMLTYTKNFFQ